MIRILKYSTLFSIILLIILSIYSIVFGSISADAPYYLSIAKDISEGVVPFKDIRTWYAPVMMYINAPIYYVFGNINYFWFLGFQYFITFLSAFVLYRIAKFNKIDHKTALFFASILYLITLLSEGIYVNLEVYVILFVLLSFYSLQYKNFLLSGILLSLSMFSKQYGFLNFIPFVLYLFYTERKIITINIVKFGTGAFITVALFCFYYVIYQEVAFKDLFSQLSGEDYKDMSITKKFNLIYYIRDAKYIIALMFPMIFIYKKEILNKSNLIILIGFIVNLLPTFFQSFPHYFILTYPYIFLFLLFNSKLLNTRYIIGSNFCMLIAFLVVMFRINKYKDDYTIQKSKSIQYEKKYPKNTTVFLDGRIRYLYLMNNYKNPVLKKIGYSDIYSPDDNFIKRYPIIKDNYVDKF